MTAIRLVLPVLIAASLCACVADTAEEPATATLDIRVLPMSALEEDLSSERFLTYTRTGEEPPAFALSVAGDLLILSKPDCTAEDLPYYFIVRFTPEDEGDLANPARSYNDEDFKPDFFEDETRCLAVTYAPAYPVSRIKVGQYERSRGARWSAWIEGSDVLRPR